MAVSSVTIDNPIDPQSISTEIVRPQIIAEFVGGTPNYDILWEWDDDVTFANGNGRRVQATDVGITTAGRYSKAPGSDLAVADGRTFYTRVTVTDNSGGGTPVASGIHDLDYSDPNPRTRSWLAAVANVGVAFDPTDLPIEVQRISHDGTGGTFTLSFSGQGPTPAQQWNETAANIKADLEALSNITTVDVEKHADGDWTVRFVDVSPDPIPAMTADDTLLTGDTAGVVISVHVDDATPWGTGGTAGADGDPMDERRYVGLVANVGVGFDPTDAPVGGWGTGGTVGPDGDVQDFRRYLGLVANVDTTQPCPTLFSISQPQIKTGESLTVKGQGLVSATSPTADAWAAEVRLYESASHAAAFVTLSITDWTAGSIEDTIVATVPGGATSGFISVVHTTTPTCDGSNFIGLTVIASDPDRSAGWWAEVWDLRNTTKLVSPIPLVHEAQFEQVANDIGNGALVLRGDDPDIDDIVDRTTNPETQSLVKIYLHDRFAYSFIPADVEEQYDDDGARAARLYGDGQETILQWGRALWKDFPAQPSVARSWIYGSSANQIGWADMEADNEIDNGSFEDADSDPAIKVGTSTLFTTTDEARTGAWSLRVTPAALDDGVEWEYSVEERQTFGDLWFKTNTLGGTYIIELLDEADAIADTDTVIPTGAGWQPVNLSAVPSGGATWKLRIRQSAGALVPFFVDDVAAYSRISGTFELTRASYQLSRTHVAEGLHSMELAMDAGGDTTFNGLVGFFPVTPNEDYTVRIPVSGPATDVVRVAVRLGGTVTSSDQILTGLGTFDVVTVTGTAGPEETTARLAVSSRETAALTVYLDDLTITPGADAAVAGQIVTDVHTAMAARGTLDFVTLNFDGTLDSAGLPWPESLQFEVDPEWTLWDLCEKLVGLGYSVELSPVNWREGGDTGWELNLWSPGNAGINWPDFDDGPAILPSDTVRDVEPSSAPPAETVAYGEGSGGAWTVATASAARITNLERREAFVRATHAKDTVSLFRIVDHRLSTSLNRGAQWTASLTDDADPLPYFDFIPHDRLRAHLPTDGTRDAVIDDTYLAAAIVFRGTGDGVGQEYEVDFGRYKLHAQRLRDLILARQLGRETSENYQPGTGSVSSGRGGASTTSPSDVSESIVTVPPHDHIWSDVGPSVGGDLSGAFPSPLVSGLRGRGLSAAAPNDGDVYEYNASTGLWTPVAPAAGTPFDPLYLDGAYTDAGFSDEIDDTAGMSGKVSGFASQWTAVGMSLGTIDELATAVSPTTSVYDFTTPEAAFGRGLMVQADQGNDFGFYADDVITDGEEVVILLELGSGWGAGNEVWPGAGFNDNNAGLFSGTQRGIAWDGQDDTRLLTITGGTLTTPAMGGWGPNGGLLFLRFMRDGTTLHSFASKTGRIWSKMDDAFNMSALDNFWPFWLQSGNFDRTQIFTIWWIRHYASTGYIPPWAT